MENIPIPLAVEIWEARRKRFLGTVAAIKVEADKWKAEKEAAGQMNPGTLKHFKIREERLQIFVDYENATLEVFESLTDTIERQRDQIRSLKSDIENNMVADLKAELRAARQRNILWGATDPIKEKIRNQTKVLAGYHLNDTFL